MTFPADFQFSQASLQDYVDCPRRFQLRYVRCLRWPAIETEPAVQNERYLRQGTALHRLIRQHLIGIPVKTLSMMATNPELRRWWRNYLERGPAELPAQRYPEVMLSASVRGYRLVARYDLIATDAGGNAVIVDWKTNRRRPSRAWLSERLQTRVYPYVLVQTGSVLGNGRVIRPDHVTMIYWFANFPAAPEYFAYDSSQYQADERDLVEIVEEVEDKVQQCADGDLLPPTEDQGLCRFCRYRSLCRRGVEPGWVDDTARTTTSEEPFDLELDFEQIAELEIG